MEQTFLYGYRTEIENSSDNRYKYIGLASCDADEEDSTWRYFIWLVIFLF